ncbi:MAG: hypothetical protein Q4B42_02675 [Oscillospiraceae bacterium]|nr:hypothetical protein [Oscillospiraceae bacterium]
MYRAESEAEIRALKSGANQISEALAVCEGLGESFEGAAAEAFFEALQTYKQELALPLLKKIGEALENAEA